MKILLIVFGLFLVLVGGVLTVASMRPAIESTLACGDIQEKRQAADQATKKYQAGKGTFEEEVLKFQSEEATQTADRGQIECDEAKAAHRGRKIISLVVLGAGVLFSILGFAIVIKRSKPGVA